jgi:hypothetical protein
MATYNNDELVGVIDIGVRFRVLEDANASGPDFRNWHFSDDLVVARRTSVHGGKSGLCADIRPRAVLDPNVWSGRASQEVFIEVGWRSCINVSGL